MSTYKNRRFGSRLRFALRGLAHALSSEASLRLQAAAAVVTIAALGILRPGALWWALVALACAAVLAAELLNTALEQLADELHPHDNDGIRRVKDCAAAAVLTAAGGAFAVAVALAAHLLGAARS
ncbi:MAG: diacylglycerol kinase [Gammaproteobacteria bacterium]|nr:diacylglycerol kinase [Gammaproteobacteria bacterium]